jgi:hypothetical protein
MNQPQSFDNVPYSNQTFSGDLVITRNAIYFFPHTDLQKEHKERYEGIEKFGLLGALIVFLAESFSFHFGSERTIDTSRFHRSGLWRREDSYESLSNKLDELISERKQQSKWLRELNNEFTDLVPVRFAEEDIKNISLSLGGKLVLTSKYDDYDFLIGLKRKKHVRNALQKAGFKT